MTGSNVPNFTAQEDVTSMPAQASEKKYKRFIIFLVDGVPTAEFERLMKAGTLPVFAELVKRGTYFNQCVTSFPSLTGPSHVPFYLDKHPAEIDFTGHNQFDRAHQQHQNYLKDYRLFPSKLKKLRTIYRDFKKPISVAEPVGKYEAKYAFNPFGLVGWFGVPWLPNAYALWRTRRAYRAGYDLITTWLHDTDAYQHIYRKPDAFVNSLKQVDKYLGHFLKEIADDTNVLIVTDHGMEPAKWSRSNLIEQLRERGINASNSRVYYDGGGMIQLFLRYPRKPWLYKPTLDELCNWPTKKGPWNILDFVARHPETEFALAEDNGKSHIESRYSSAVIWEQDEKLHYRITRGEDPLNYKYDPIAKTILERPVTADESLHLTAHTQYPDALYQIHKTMQAPSVANIILTTTAGYTPNLLTRYAVHGGLRTAQMRTFALFTKPIPEKNLPLRTHHLPRLIKKYKA